MNTYLYFCIYICVYVASDEKHEGGREVGRAELEMRKKGRQVEKDDV
jgi:hypothetical protein